MRFEFLMLLLVSAISGSTSWGSTPKIDCLTDSRLSDPPNGFSLDFQLLSQEGGTYEAVLKYDPSADMKQDGDKAWEVRRSGLRCEFPDQNAPLSFHCDEPTPIFSQTTRTTFVVDFGGGVLGSIPLSSCMQN